MKAGICITARIKSKRLPAKVLKYIGNKMTIEILLTHCIKYSKFPVVLAIPENSDDDKLAEIAENYPVELYRGEDDSPLHRMSAVAKKWGWDYIIRVTADDILIDQELLQSQVSWAINNELDYVYMGRCPEGVAAEVIRSETLIKIADETKQPIEFVSYLLKKEGVKYKEFFPPSAYQFSARLTMDYPEDLELLRELDRRLPTGYTTLSIIDHLKLNRYLLRMNALPRVTVYICNYNYAEHVCDAIDSVLGQSYRDYELLIVDDGSTDDSARVISQHLTKRYLPTKVKFYANDKNKGLPFVCNQMLEIARGRYIVRLDSDDIMLPNFLEKMINKLDADTSIRGVYCDYQEIKDNGNIIPINTVEKKKHIGCALLQRACVNEIKFKDGVNLGEGDDFYSRYDKHYSMAYLPEILWNYRRHDGQKTGKKHESER